MNTKSLTLDKTVPVGAGPFAARKEKSRRQFRITRQGWYYLALTLGVGFAALRTGNNLLFLVLGMMLGMVLLSGIMAELALRGLTLHREPPGRMYSCRPFLMKVSVKNEKKWLPSFSVEVEDILEGQLMDKRCYFLKVPAGRRQTTSYRHAFPRRGKYRFLGFKVSTKFPFGLLRKSIIVKGRGETLVFPSPHKVPFPPKATATLSGARARRRLQRFGDPFGLREYRPGDDPRQIHHKASAHLNRLVVREFEDTTANRVVLYLDNGLRLKEGESYLGAGEALELTVGRAAYLAELLLEQGVEVSVVTRSGVVPFGAGGPHLVSVMRFLALLPYEDGDVPLPMNRHSRADAAVFIGRAGVMALDGSGGSKGRGAGGEA